MIAADATDKNELPDKPKRELQFVDLRTDYCVIGRLNREFGTFVTVKGIWGRDDVDLKRREWMFRIAAIEGKAIEKPVEFRIDEVDLFDARGRPIEMEGSPREGEVWEVRCFERIVFIGTPKDWFKETGLPYGDALPWRMTTSLECIRWKVNPMN